MAGEIYAEDAAVQLGVTPTRFVDILRRNKEILPVLYREHRDGKRFCLNTTQFIDSFYDGHIGPAADKLGSLVLYTEDWEAFLASRITNEAEKAKDARIAELEREVAKLKEQRAEDKSQQLIEIDRTRSYLETPSGMEALKTFFSRTLDGNPQGLALLDKIFAAARKNNGTKVTENPPLFCEGPRIAELEAQLTEVKAKLAEEQKENADLKEQLAAKEGIPKEENATAAQWAASVTTVCKAAIEAYKTGRKDWVSGLDGSTGDTDSAGDETFMAVVKQISVRDKTSVHTKAERAAWKALSDMGLKWGAGRKPKKRIPENPASPEPQQEDGTFPF